MKTSTYIEYGIGFIFILFFLNLLTNAIRPEVKGGREERIVHPETREYTVIGYKTVNGSSDNLIGAVFYQPGTMKKGILEWGKSDFPPPGKDLRTNIGWPWISTNIVVFDKNFERHKFVVDQEKLSLIAQWERDENKKFLKTELFQKVWNILPHYPRTASFEHPETKKEYKFWFRSFKMSEDDWKYVVYKLNKSSDLYRKKNEKDDQLVLTIDGEEFQLKWGKSNLIIVDQEGQLNRLTITEEEIGDWVGLLTAYEFEDRFNDRVVSIIEILEGKN